MGITVLQAQRWRADGVPMTMSHHEFKYPKVTPVQKPAGTVKSSGGEPPKR